MSASILDGKALAKSTRQALKVRVEALLERGVQPRLDVIVAGQDPSSLAYVAMKRKWAAEIGMASGEYVVDSGTSQAQLMDHIASLNGNPDVHGVLIQHPLQKHLDEPAALEALGYEKDVDGITPQSMGRLVCGLPGFRCATPLGMMRMLDHYAISVKGLHALVIGRSVILGKPAALMLLERDATVTIAHRSTRNIADLCREADVIVAAVGKPEMVKADWIKPGAIVLDAGYNRVEGRTHDVGDVDFEAAKQVASWITPVPGGVGPMTVASLLSNCVDAAEASIGT